MLTDCVTIYGSTENPTLRDHSGLLPIPGIANGSMPPSIMGSPFPVVLDCREVAYMDDLGWNAAKDLPFPHLQPQLLLAFNGRRCKYITMPCLRFEGIQLV